MKKALLLASLLLAGSSAFAGVDPNTYEPKEGFTLTNKWLKDGKHFSSEWKALSFAGSAYARTAAIAGDKIYVAWSKVVEAGEVIDYGNLNEFDFNGNFIRQIKLTLNGEPLAYSAPLSCNQVGCDDFGHVYVAGYTTGMITEDGALKPFKIYTVDLETGAVTLAAELNLTDGEAQADYSGRVDYCHVIGDITGQEARAVAMCAVNAGSKLLVYGWSREQGGDWAPHFADGEYATWEATESYPADQTSWSYAPMVTIIKDDEFSGELFYVDGFTTLPALYNTDGTMLESFASIENGDMLPKAGTNGVGEVNIGGTDFLLYSFAQYDQNPGCQAVISKLGENQSFNGMTELWRIPADGLGSTVDGTGFSDTGTRIHSIQTVKFVDVNGKEGAYIVTFKCMNGIGVYVLAEEGFIDSGVADVEMDLNAPIEYYNLNGVRVDSRNLVPGLYITRQGAKASKVVVK